MPRWVRLAQLVLDDERVDERFGPDAEMSLLFVDEPTIAELNERFLGAHGPTDVLAFPIDDEVPPGAASPTRAAADPARRPIPAIRRRCSATSSCARRSRSARRASAASPVDDELALLVVHGVLHLLDYDHAEPEEATVMRRREQELLERFRELEGRRRGP